MFAIALVGLALTGALMAQERPCPDQVTETIDVKVTPLFPQVCGTNLRTIIAGVEVTTPVNVCPLVVIVRPGHDTSVSRPGSGTYTIPVETVPILGLRFECKASWLLGILPIEVSSHCMESSSRNVGAVTHYEQVSCREDPTPGDLIDEELSRRLGSIETRRRRS